MMGFIKTWRCDKCGETVTAYDTDELPNDWREIGPSYSFGGDFYTVCLVCGQKWGHLLSSQEEERKSFFKS